MSVNGPNIAKAGLALTAVLAGSKILEGLTTTKHDQAVKEAYGYLAGAAARDTTVYSDHISKGPSTRGAVDGLDGVPDLVVKSVTQNNLIIEVETTQSIESNPVHAAEQLGSFSKPGYRRVLVVPPEDVHSDSVVDWANTVEKELDGKLHTARTDNVRNLL